MVGGVNCIALINNSSQIDEFQILTKKIELQNKPSEIMNFLEKLDEEACRFNVNEKAARYKFLEMVYHDGLYNIPKNENQAKKFEDIFMRMSEDYISEPERSSGEREMAEFYNRRILPWLIDKRINEIQEQLLKSLKDK